MNALKCRTSSSRLLATVCVMSLALSFFVISDVPAGSIVRDGIVQDQGKGFGNILVVLSHEDTLPKGNAADGKEFGSVSWNGSKDVLTGEARTQSQTRTVAEMTAVGITDKNLAVIFNINNPGNDPTVHVHEFVLRGFDKTGKEIFTSKFEAKSVSGEALTMVGNGQGGAGHVFNVTGTDTGISLAAFFADPTNRLGQEVLESQAIDDHAAGGADDFYVGAVNVINPVPEPASMTLLGIGIAGMMGYGWRRRRQGAAQESTPSVA